MSNKVWMNSDPCRFRKISKLKPRPKKKLARAGCGYGGAELGRKAHEEPQELVKGAESSWAWIKAMSFVRLDSRRGNVFEHIILRHGEELGLKGMKHDEVLQNLKLSDLKFVYVFYKNVLYVLNAPCWAENNKL